MLGDNEVPFGVLVNLEHAHDIWMILKVRLPLKMDGHTNHLFKNVYFLEEPSFFLALQETFFDNLHRAFCSRLPVSTQSHLAEGA